MALTNGPTVLGNAVTADCLQFSSNVHLLVFGNCYRTCKLALAFRDVLF
jgi:hypothetical protein